MDIDKVRELTDAELAEELIKQRRHLYDLRFQLATRQLTDYSQLTQARRAIARILTVATEREITGVGPVPAVPKTRATAPKSAVRTRVSGRAKKEAAAEPASRGEKS